MKPPTKPRLSPGTVGDDGALTDTIPAALTSPTLAPFTAEVLRRQRALRDVLTDAQMQAYLGLEEVVNDRIAAESVALVRWAWREGRRVGRREGRREGGANR